MRVQAEPSGIIANLDGVECRVWNAVTEDGKQLFLFVHRAASREDLGGELLPRITLKTEMKEQPHEA